MLLGLLYRFGHFDPSQLGHSVTHPWWALAAGLCLLITIPLGSQRWLVLLRAQGVHYDSGRLLMIFFAAQFANTFFLGSVGGDAVRAAYVCRREQGSRAPAMASIVLDRTMGLCALVISATLMLPLNMTVIKQSPLMGAVALSVVSLCAGLGVFFISALFLAKFIAAYGQRRQWETSDRLIARLWRLLNALSLFRHQPKTLLMGLGYSLAIQILSLAGIVMTCRSMGEMHLAATDYAFAGSLALVANILPLTPGGLGVGEGAFANICALMGPASTALGYAGVFLAFRVLSILVSLPGLAAYAMLHRR